MKRNRRRRTGITFSHLRWTSYATAVGASAVAAAPTAEAEIHYSGLINSKFRQEHGRLTHSFLLSQGAVLVGFRSAFGGGDSSATFEIKGAAHSNAFRAYSSSSSAAAALPRGVVISQGHFGFPFGTIVGRLQDYVCDFPGWQEPGTYYLGFRFNSGAGMQYGWVRIKWGGCTDSGEPHNEYVVKDYAWGDVGDQIKTGQKTLNDTATPVESSAKTDAPLAPAEGSLGLLALGAVGLQAWRKSRRAE